jgi:hypothetical protein
MSLSIRCVSFLHLYYGEQAVCHILSRSEQYFLKPNTFIPERWSLKDTQATMFVKDHFLVSSLLALAILAASGRSLALTE